MKQLIKYVLIAQVAAWPVAGYSYHGVVSPKLSETSDRATVAEVMPGLDLEEITASLGFQNKLSDPEYREAVRALGAAGGAALTLGQVREFARARRMKTADLVLGVACGVGLLATCAVIWACVKGGCGGGGGGGGMDINDPANPASPLSPANPANPASPLNPLNMM